MIGWAESRDHDPYRNLAIEEQLLDLCGDGPILYLWQNARTVVLGRNQDPWRECRVALLEAEGGCLARRLSGGGAVYHDLGNLNFSFLARREAYDVSRQTQVVQRAVERLGLRAGASGRNDLTADGRKFSGSAFYERGDRCCHHGTVMFHVDAAAMARYLTVPESKLASKGVSSVEARVTNLWDLLPGVTVEAGKAALLSAFEDIYGEKCRKVDLSALDAEGLAAGEARFRDPTWLYGRWGELPIERTRRFSWGEVSVRLRASRGRIAEAAVYSDAMDPAWVGALRERLIGAACESRSLLAALDECHAPEAVRRDLAAWIEKWGTELEV